MALVRFGEFYTGALAVYTSKTGLLDLRTGLAEYGGNFYEGQFADLTEMEAQQLSPNLHTGRYRIVHVDSGATAANIVQGTVAGVALGRSVAQVAITGLGSGQTTGTYTIAASTGTAVAQVVIGAGGTIISATVLNGGSNYAAVPTFTVAAGGTPGTIVAQMSVNENVVTSYDQAISVYSIRGVFLAPVTAAQVAAGAWVLMQELGIATLLAASGLSNNAVGSNVNVTTGGVVNTVLGSTSATGLTIGVAIDAPVSSSLFRATLELPVRQG